MDCLWCREEKISRKALRGRVRLNERIIPNWALNCVEPWNGCVPKHNSTTPNVLRTTTLLESLKKKTILYFTNLKSRCNSLPDSPDFQGTCSALAAKNWRLVAISLSSSFNRCSSSFFCRFFNFSFFRHLRFEKWRKDRSQTAIGSKRLYIWTSSLSLPCALMQHKQLKMMLQLKRLRSASLGETVLPVFLFLLLQQDLLLFLFLMPVGEGLVGSV